MPLQKQRVDVDFLGLDTKTQERQVIPGQLTNLENAEFDKVGRVIKRKGYTALGTTDTDGNSITAGKHIATFDDELLMSDDEQFYSYSDGQTKWKPKGPLYSGKINLYNEARANLQQDHPQYVESADYRVFLYQYASASDTTLYFVVFDKDTGTQLSHQSVAVEAGGFGNTKLAFLGTQLVVYWNDNSTLNYRAYDSTNNWAAGTLSNYSAILTADTGDFLIKDYNATYSLILAEDNVGGGNFAIKAFYVDSNGDYVTAGGGAPASVTTIVSDTNAKVLGGAGNLYVSGTSIFFSYTSAGNFVLSLMDNTFSVTYTKTQGTDFSAPSSTTLARSRAAVNSDDTCRWFFQGSRSGDLHPAVWYYDVTAAGSVGTGTLFKYQVTVAADVIQVADDQYFLPTIHSSAEQASYFLLNQDSDVAAAWLIGNGGDPTEENAYPCVVTTSATGIYTWACRVRQQLNTASGMSYTAEQLTRVEFDTTSEVFSHAPVGQSLALAGNFVQTYDGEALYETGTFLYPEEVNYTPSTSGGSMDAGTYLYKVIYEYRNAKGEIVRSTPTTAESVTIASGSSGSVAVDIPDLDLTNKGSTVGGIGGPTAGTVGVVYRTTAGGSETYYRVGSVSVAPTGSQDYSTYTDTDDDASITSNEVLYTVGGELANNFPPPVQHLIASDQRLFLASTERNDEVHYSKDFVFGEVPGFNRSQFQVAGGTVKALAKMDNNYIAFTKDKIYAFVGEGPDATGANNTFSQPQEVSLDVGCDNPRSIVNVDRGVMFQSSKGIRLLNRSLQVEYVGEPVEDFNADTVTSAVLLEDRNQVRFTLDSAKILVYNYELNHWSIFDIDAVDAVSYQDNYNWLKSDGTVLQESSSVYTDDGVSYNMTAETGWISLAGINGYQRLYEIMILGDCDRDADHTLQVKLYYDYSGTAAETITNTVSTSSTEVYQFRIRPSKQKCTAFRLEISDTEGNGFELHKLSLRVGVKATPNRIANI